jgi:hypothetical protein
MRFPFDPLAPYGPSVKGKISGAEFVGWKSRTLRMITIVSSVVETGSAVITRLPSTMATRMSMANWH